MELACSTVYHGSFLIAEVSPEQDWIGLLPEELDVGRGYRRLRMSQRCAQDLAFAIVRWM